MDNNIISKVAALGGTISTTDISHLSEYKRLLRAKERGDLIKLRHGIYAVPDTLLNTMIDVERIVPNGIVCLYNAWAYHQLSTTVPPAFCIAIANKRKVVIPDTLPIELYYWKKRELGVWHYECRNFRVSCSRHRHGAKCLRCCEIQKQIGAGCLYRSDTLLSEKAQPKSHSFARLCQTPQSI